MHSRCRRKEAEKEEEDRKLKEEEGGGFIFFNDTQQVTGCGDSWGNPRYPVYLERRY